MKIGNEILLKLHVNFVEQSTRIIMELNVNETLRSEGRGNVILVGHCTIGYVY